MSVDSIHINNTIKLQGTINTMDALAQAGADEIAAIAWLALCAMENPKIHKSETALAHAFLAIKAKADDISELIGYEAEQVGCSWKNESISKIREAHSAAFCESKQ
jgi:hypothetical protein